MNDYTPKSWGWCRAVRGGASGSSRAAELVAETGDVPSAVVERTLAGMADRLAEYDDVYVERAFWDGFVRGVKAILVEALNARWKQN